MQTSCFNLLNTPAFNQSVSVGSLHAPVASVISEQQRNYGKDPIHLLSAGFGNIFIIQRAPLVSQSTTFFFFITQ